MIHITDPRECCGCNACQQACPVGCITLTPDTEGFCYPHIDESKCISCNKCQRVCPVINKTEPVLPENVIAAKNPDETIRRESSSGGIFTMIAESVIREGGIVFGAAFANDWTVQHRSVDTIEQLAALRGSKYMQSRIGDSFIKCRDALKTGRKVLFSGTPCQIAGLRRFLGKENPGLTTVDFVCHGVPSPKIWLEYLHDITDNTDRIKSISFRSKSNGWKSYCMNLTLHAEASGSCSSSGAAGPEGVCALSEPFFKNAYMASFLSNINLRPACYSCPAKAGRSGADITLGDYWGIDHVRPDFDDDHGVSLIIANSEHGQSIVDALDIASVSTPLSDALRHNPSITTSVNEPINRAYFFRQLRHHSFTQAWHATASTALTARIRRKLYRIFS